MNKALKIAWVISIVLSVLVTFLAAKYSLWRVTDKVSLAVYSFPFHLGIILTFVLVYRSWFKPGGKRKILDYSKKGVFSLFVGTYLFLSILFIWLFLLR
jgi:hypothetical protein